MQMFSNPVDDVLNFDGVIGGDGSSEDDDAGDSRGSADRYSSLTRRYKGRNTESRKKSASDKRE